MIPVRRSPGLRRLVVLCGAAAMTLAVATPAAAQWKAVADFSACPRQYISETHGEEHGFATQQQCQARVSQAQASLACARYQCLAEGSGQTGDAGGGDLVNQSTQALVKGFVNNNPQEMSLGLLGLGMNSLMQGMQGDPGHEAQLAAERQQQARAAAAAAQRRAAEAALHAAEIKGQLLAGIGDVDPAPAAPIVTANGDIKLLSSDELLGGTGTKFFGSGGNGCAVSQDPSVVDLCGLGDRPVVDPSAIQIAPNAPSVGGAGLTIGAPDAVLRPNPQTANADVAPRAAASPKSAPPPAPEKFNAGLSPAAVVPLLRQPEPVSPSKPSFVCQMLSQQREEIRQLSRRADLASDVYRLHEAGEADLLAKDGFDRVDVDSDAMKKLLPGEKVEAIKDLLEPDNSNYRAAIYKDRTTNKMFVVFRGTQPFSEDDWHNGNADQAFGLASAYYKRAMDLAVKLKQAAATQKPPLELELIGHSMGGGMADAAGAAYRIKTTSFNPSGVSPATLPKGTDMSIATQYDTDYVVKGEILNNYQDHPIATRAALSADLALGGPATVMGAVSNIAAGATSEIVNSVKGDTVKGIQETTAAFSAVLPPSIGQRVTLDPDPADINAAGPAYLHIMSSVQDAIGKQSQELSEQYKANACGS